MEKVTRKGTAMDKVTPVKKATMDTSAEVLLFIMGSRVSIDVAPPRETDSRWPIYFATIGTVIIAKTSLITLVKKAKLPSSMLILESSIAEKEYHPRPILIAIPSPIYLFVTSEARYPPTKDPTIVPIGSNQIFLPKFESLEKIDLLFPISIPTKSNKRQSPNVIKKSACRVKKLFLKK